MNDVDNEPRAFIDSIPALAWSASSDGFALSVNRRWLDYTGLTEEAALGWGWTVNFPSRRSPQSAGDLRECPGHGKAI